jgi:hypothetical protein
MADCDPDSSRFVFLNHAAVSAVDIPRLSVRIQERPELEAGREEPGMNIEIRDRALEARIQRQIQATGSGSVEEVLLRLLETQEEQDRWLLENREANDAKIRRGTEQLDRGEGIPDDRLDAYLAELKSKPE